MSIRILRQDVFPITCINPACNRKYDVEDFINVINLQGLIYADCSDTIYQVITCECKKPNLIPNPRNNPIVDLRDFIITPNPHLTNLFEQVKERERVKDDNDLLNFKFIPAWDDEAVSYDEILKFYHNVYGDFRHGNFSPIDIPYILTPEVFQERLNNEYTTGETQLRRLYPDIPKFRNLLTCMSPNRITGFDFEYGSGARAEGNTQREIQWRNNAWTGLLEEVVGKPLKETVIEYLQSRKVFDFNEDIIDDEIRSQLFYMNYDPANRIRELSRVVGFEAKVWDCVKEELNKFLYPVCTKVTLDKSRKKLLGWTNNIEKGKALFVDAPMGLGKTYAIVEALVENPEMSAVIFMPTIRLCKEIKERLENSIVSYKFNKKIEQNETVDPNYPSIFRKDEYGNDEVYFVDGINKNECPNFHEIIERYSENWIIKGDICTNCDRKAECRFISHWAKAPQSRVVLTTHHQYDHFYNQVSFHKWYKHGYDNEDRAVDRNVFIVDEDLVISKCYQPIGLDHNKIRAFTATVIEFLSNFEGMDETITKIESLFSRISLCEKSAIITCIDPDFAFPKKVVKEWDESFKTQFMFIPDILIDPKMIGNHLELIEKALRLGVVVQRHGTVNKALFPNPKTYDLLNLPPHVFFDGTMIDNKFMKKFIGKKLHNVKFKKKKIDVKVPWKLRVWQNENTDLPKKWKRFKNDEPKVKQFVRELLNECGNNYKYFFITSKAIREGYLKSFLDQEYPKFFYILEHFGNIRGINDASECDIGIMLGSYVPSDAVEIAMALEHIQDKLPKKKLFATVNNLWTWKGSKSQRVYKDEYAIVGEMAKAFRINEHRQAIARTRYLFHDVDFYVLSKDPVDEYEKYATVKDYQYRNDIFPPRPERQDSKYEEVKKAVNNLIRKYDSTTEMEIHQKKGFSRTTIRKYLKRMLGDGELVREKTKYKFPLTPENGQDII